MKEILKTLFKYKFQILFVIILLVVQAYCDLALPSYTSNIIDIGIKGYGIESYTPEVIRESEYLKLKSAIASTQELRILDSSYTFIEKGNNKYINDYPILEKENLYVLTKEDDSLEEILMYPLLSISENKSLSEVKKEYKTNNSVINGKIVNYLKKEYETVGINIKNKEKSYIYKTGGKMLLIAFVGVAITFLSVYISTYVASYFSRDLRKKLVEKTMDFESEEINSFKVSSLITRTTNDIVQIQMLLTVFLRIIIFAPIIGIGAITKVTGSEMGWVIALAVIVILSIMLILFVIVVPKFKLFQELLDRLNLVSREILTGVPVIRAFTNEKKEEEKFETENEKITKNGLFVNSAMAIMSPTLTIIMNSVSILIVWVGASKINTGSLEVGELVALITYTMQIITAFLMVSMVAVMLPRALVSIKRISEVLNKKVTITEPEKTEKFKDTNEHKVEFKDVYFRYPSSAEDVLRNINFEAKSGEVVAFIGGTGSGKSTLVNLIPRFFDVTNGKILIDGLDIKKVKLKDLRNMIGYVPQKGELFTGTVLSNISLGLKKDNLEISKNAATISQIDDFIESQEDKYNMEISEKGTNVSGGQRQRLSIARAIAKDAPIYIFDDATSALDYKTDASLRHELKRVGKNKIIFIVAQRISSVMHADKIVVLNDGEIVGIGKHEELLKTCDIYKEIKVSQLGGED